jgi:hypothetical protein
MGPGRRDRRRQPRHGRRLGPLPGRRAARRPPSLRPSLRLRLRRRRSGDLRRRWRRCAQLTAAGWPEASPPPRSKWQRGLSDRPGLPPTLGLARIHQPVLNFEPFAPAAVPSAALAWNRSGPGPADSFLPLFLLPLPPPSAPFLLLCPPPPPLPPLREFPPSNLFLVALFSFFYEPYGLRSCL